MQSLYAVLLALAPGVFLASLFLLLAWFVKGKVTMIYDGSYQTAAHYATLGGLVLLVLGGLSGLAAGRLDGPPGLLLLAAVVIYAVSAAIGGRNRRELPHNSGGQMALVATQIVGFALLLALLAARAGGAGA